MQHEQKAVLELRLRLRNAGFSPLPINGKKPVQDRWQTLVDSSDDEILAWDRSFPSAQNTGILSARVPTLDIDITNQEAADAVEALVRGRFTERGQILIRFGQPPKRAILFQTDVPFKHLGQSLIGPDGRGGQKIELLCDGQQVVVAGTHPKTGAPYRWFGGEPGAVARRDLPPISAALAATLVDDAADLLVRDFGYRRPEAARTRSDDRRIAFPADWGLLAENIRAGHELHDSLRDLAAKLVAPGMANGAAINFLRQLMEHAACAHDERWRERRDDIPRLVESAVEKIRRDPKPCPKAPPRSLAEVHDVFRRWLGDEYDLATLDTMLAVAAAERLPGDPVWLLIISGSGNAKTETVQATSGLGAEVVSKITSDAALLSATPRSHRAKNATGGLLAKLGPRGILAIKDVTSIIAMDRNIRASVLAALREIHDGKWVRHVGSDGGQTLVWEGRVVVIGACTTAWDAAHSVIATMGERFVIIRSDSRQGRIAAGRRAMRNTGDEAAMRQELTGAVSGLVANVEVRNVYSLNSDDENTILNAANLTTLARTAIEADYRGEVIDVHAPEMPTRFAKQLVQIMRGSIAIGMNRLDALQLVLRCARDSMPQLRLDVLRDVAENPGTRVVDVRRRLQKPRTTIDRTLQALHILGLLLCEEKETERGGKPVLVRHYSLAEHINLTVLADVAKQGNML